jgi:hypothetical protein
MATAMLAFIDRPMGIRTWTARSHRRIGVPRFGATKPQQGAKAAAQCQRSENPADERHHHAMSGMMMLSSV